MTDKRAALAAVLLLAACKAEPETPAVPDAAPIPYQGAATSVPDAGGPKAGTTRSTWAYNGEGAHMLALGAPKGETLEVVFRCEAAIDGIKFAFFQSGTPPISVKVASGSASAVWPVRPSPPDYQISADWTLAGDAPEHDPVLAAFLRTGVLTRWYGAEAITWTAKTPGERDAIAKFAAGCGGKL